MVLVYTTKNGIGQRHPKCRMNRYNDETFFVKYSVVKIDFPLNSLMKFKLLFFVVF